MPRSSPIRAATAATAALVLLGASAPRARAQYAPLPPARPAMPCPCVGPAAARINAAVASPDGRLVAVLDDSGRIAVWDARRGARLRTIASGYRTPISRFALGPPLAFSPDGRRLAAGGDDGRVRVWDVASGRRVMVGEQAVRGVQARGDSLPPLELVNDGLITAVAFSPDGLRLASAASDGSVAVWAVDVWTGGPEVTLWVSDPGLLRDVAFSGDGTALAVAAETTLRIVSLITQRSAPVDTGYGGAYRVRFSPSGSLLAATWHDAEARVYAVATRERLYAVPFPDGGQPRFLTFSPDGRALAAADKYDVVRVWESRGGALLEAHRGAPGLVALWFTADGRGLVAADAHHRRARLQRLESMFVP